MKKKVFILVIILVVVGFGVYKYVYQEHRDIATEDASFTTTVQEVFGAFKTNEGTANAKYSNKTLVIKGKISEIDFEANIITVDENLSATFTDKLSQDSKVGDSITLKGRLVGYDGDIMNQIQMDQCTKVE
ncbi:OB-fold protein [Flavobacterium terrisoli]|uniref:OB-fold protein n=1 Tax=Flavobacterium terrisoli TaxID=3242195 RepID=UPI002542E5DC|nr:hypothetical protein [Flavobacterium buctense]